jgi:hypothetical protein
MMGLKSRHESTVSWLPAAALLPAVVLNCMVTALRAEEAARNARDILKAMTDYLSSVPSLSFEVRSVLDVTLSAKDAATFEYSGHALVVRPDKFRFLREGKDDAIEFIFDGQALTIFDRDASTYAQIPLIGTIDDAIAKLRSGGVSFPGADFIANDSYGMLTEGVARQELLADVSIDGQEYHSVRLTSPEAEVNVLVTAEGVPLPRRYSIERKHGLPAYTLDFLGIEANPELSAADFDFDPSVGATRVEVERFFDLDAVQTVP